MHYHEILLVLKRESIKDFNFFHVSTSFLNNFFIFSHIKKNDFSIIFVSLSSSFSN